MPVTRQRLMYSMLFLLLALTGGCAEDDDGGGGGGSSSGGGNVAPSLVITQLPANGSAGDVLIGYMLTDPDSASVDVTIEAQDQSAGSNPFVDISANQGTGSDGVTGLSASASGDAHVFVWDTSAVATTAPVSFVVRIIPDDGTDAGAPVLSAAFTIDNSGGGTTVTAPEVYTPTPIRTLYGNAFVPYSLIETNTTQQPSNSVQIEYSICTPATTGRVAPRPQTPSVKVQAGCSPPRVGATTCSCGTQRRTSPAVRTAC